MRVWKGLAAGGLALGAAVGAFAVLDRPVEEIPRTVADDPSLPSASPPGTGVTFHAEAFGDPANPTVLVLHGGPGGDYRNLLVLNALADEYRVVFYDQRGSGLSERVPAEQHTLDVALSDLDAFVDAYGGGRPVALVGHSWGAMLAAFYLGRHPEKVFAAALAEPGVLTSEELNAFVAAMQPTMSLGLLLAGTDAWIESRHVGGDAYAADDYLIARMAFRAGPENAMNRYWCGGVAPPAAADHWRVGALAMTATPASIRGEDGKFHFPPLGAEAYPGEVLLIASECNELIGVERQRAHVALFRDARLEVVAGAGHLMFTDRPAESLALLRGYLASQRPPLTRTADEPERGPAPPPRADP